MSTQPPLHEVQQMLNEFLDSKTSTAIDLKKVSQLVDVAIREHEIDLIGFAQWMASIADFVDSTDIGNTYYYKNSIYTTKEMFEIYKLLNK